MPAKIIPLKAGRARDKLEPRERGGECPRCHHRMNVHITHPDGVKSCAARGCRCETRLSG